MRALTLTPLALAALLALLLAACGGNGDGGEAVDLPPPGEYLFDVTGTMEIELAEELVSAGPVTLQQTQSVDLSGTATFDIGPGGVTFNIPQFGISGTITVQGEDSPVELTQNPDMPSTGAVGSDGTSVDLFLEIEVADTFVVRNDDPLPLESSEPLAVEIVPLDLMSVDPIRVSFGDGEEGVLFVVSVDLTFTPTEPDLITDGAAEGPPAAQFPAGFEYLNLFGFSGDQAADVTRIEDGPGGHIYADPTFPSGFTGDVADLLGVDHALINITPEAAQILDVLYPCGQSLNTLETVCSDPSAPFPSGDIYFFSSQPAAPPPPLSDPLFTDHECIWATTLSVQGDDNFVPGESFPDDFYGGTFYWNELIAGLGGGYANKFTTAGREPVPGANVRTIIDRGANWTTTLIPAEQVPDATGFRVSVDCHLADFNPAGSGGDPLGGRPSVDGPFPLATNVIPIDGTFPGLITGPGDLPPAEAQLGDVNCDGKVDSIDAALVLQFDVGLIDSLPCPDAGDVNGDGQTNSIDAALILQFNAGLIPSLPPGGDDLVPVEPPQTIIE